MEKSGAGPVGSSSSSSSSSSGRGGSRSAAAAAVAAAVAGVSGGSTISSISSSSSTISTGATVPKHNTTKPSRPNLASTLYPSIATTRSIIRRESLQRQSARRRLSLRQHDFSIRLEQLKRDLLAYRAGTRRVKNQRHHKAEKEEEEEKKEKQQSELEMEKVVVEKVEELTSVEVEELWSDMYGDCVWDGGEAERKKWVGWRRDDGGGKGREVGGEGGGGRERALERLWSRVEKISIERKEQGRGKK